MTCSKSEILNRRDVCFISASSDNGWTVNFEWVQQTHKQEEPGAIRRPLRKHQPYILSMLFASCEDANLRQLAQCVVALCTVSSQKFNSVLILFISVWQNDMKVYLLLKSLKHRCTSPKRFSFLVCQSLKPALRFGIWTSAFKQQPNERGALVCPQNVMSAVLRDYAFL